MFANGIFCEWVFSLCDMWEIANDFDWGIVSFMLIFRLKKLLPQFKNCFEWALRFSFFQTRHIIVHSIHLNLWKTIFFSYESTNLKLRVNEIVFPRILQNFHVFFNTNKYSDDVSLQQHLQHNICCLKFHYRSNIISYLKIRFCLMCCKWVFLLSFMCLFKWNWIFLGVFVWNGK